MTAKETIKEFPPEKTLDMIAKCMELAGVLVDEKLQLLFIQYLAFTAKYVRKGIIGMSKNPFAKQILE